MKFLGTGTEKLEEQAAHTFFPARVLRWDSDTTSAKGSHGAISQQFRDHQADILVGTQMIAKGLDFPNVTLVGVINADTGLNLPDFRASERTFQLLSQVAGRAGRGPDGGRVVIQTYNPSYYAIQAAAKHDYTTFYDKEITYRRQLNYPPFARLASMVYSHTSEAACRSEAERMAAELDTESKSRGVAGVSLIGPATAFIYRLRGRFRWQIVVRGQDLSTFLGEIGVPQGWSIDIDPVGLV